MKVGMVGWMVGLQAEPSCPSPFPLPSFWRYFSLVWARNQPTPVTFLVVSFWRGTCAVPRDAPFLFPLFFSPVFFFLCCVFTDFILGGFLVFSLVCFFYVLGWISFVFGGNIMNYLLLQRLQGDCLIVLLASNKCKPPIDAPSLSPQAQTNGDAKTLALLRPSTARPNYPGPPIFPSCQFRNWARPDQGMTRQNEKKEERLDKRRAHRPQGTCIRLNRESYFAGSCRQRRSHLNFCHAESKRKKELTDTFPLLVESTLFSAQWRDGAEMGRVPLQGCVFLSVPARRNSGRWGCGVSVSA